MKKYFKIYTKDEQDRQIIKLLHTAKSYQEVKEKYGRCEEMFDHEAEHLKSIVAYIDEAKNDEIFHEVENIIADWEAKNDDENQDIEHCSM